jgi:hypothetical protein
MSQITNSILMVRPSRFQFNAETAVSNAFQKQLQGLTETEIYAKAQAEFDGFVAKLRAHGVNVCVVEDTPEPAKPDAVFPNNWVSFHADGTVFLYPMCTPNRRLERRSDIIETIAKDFDVKKVIDLSPAEEKNEILEGTGSMVLDHKNKVIYACLSPRTHHSLLNEYAQLIGYEVVSFTSLDENGGEVYHTNVVMCMGDGFSVICLDSIKDEAERAKVAAKLRGDGNEIVDISFAQMNQFAGNMLQVQSDSGKSYLVMSATAYKALTPAQVAQIEQFTTILFVEIDTIEMIGGGSARCMMAEIFCEKKK